MISIKFFQHNDVEFGINAMIDDNELYFIYVPSNDDVKFLIPEYGEEFQTLYDMLITYDIRPERIDEFIKEFEYLFQNVI